ncbi:CRISPR-associated helicase/endonuclease Cas3 [Rothia sp. HMSC065D02]|uniref:CRISPR-associated helicase/endonuclease Cas3 n=1 Tax=Rothia sp. HMSC065D02 TaxID=1739518 RepID=UPI0008A50192|nr:CRISPR-associated helicase/endonuclease Cas3 [Rothia sp. HMSC065D02]OFO77090.1 CRISPR-associated helicase/endonuclease Cas3 [Rothia sp. HMSC065D02]
MIVKDFTRPSQLASAEASSLWAKTGSEESPSVGLSLPQHMTDAGSVAAELWDKWLSPGAKQRIMELLNLTQNEAKSFACWVAATHDMGKATPEFAGQLDSRGKEELRVFRDRIEEHKFNFPLHLTTPPAGTRCPHSTYSQSIIIKLLTERYTDDVETAKTIASIAGAHHGVPAEYVPETGRACAIFEGLNDKWHQAWQELFEMTLEQTGADQVLKKLMSGTKIPVSVQLYLTGLVIMADWIASNPEYFPMGTFSVEAQHGRLNQGWEALGLEHPWAAHIENSDTSDLYSSRFSWENPTLRPMQEVVVEAARSMKGGGMMCIEAPMGQGKTEAGLIAAEILAQETGRSGLAFAAPTQVTSNALFDRVKAWAQGPAGGSEPHTMFLGHAKNQQQDSFRYLQRADIFDSEADVEGKQSIRPNTSVARHSWIGGRKRGILSTFVVCTIDQILMMALQSRHVMLRHLGLGSKVVIIDEVHAYDAYMGVYLKEALHWLGQMNAPVILMSATLPAHVRTSLMESYAEGLEIQDSTEWDFDDDFDSEDVTGPSLDLDYPVIHTLTAEDGYTPRKWQVTAPEEQVTAPEEQVTISIRQIGDEFTDFDKVLEPLESGHGCAAVICNTVGRAQNAYEHLRAKFGADVMLTHSRFTSKHRAEKEADLVSQLGKGAHRGDGRPERLIVVGTQVIEQSLDLDFDVMVTDFAPVDLVLQRLGRLHRHERDDSERPSEYRSPICYVRGVEIFGSETQVPEFPKGSRSVYEPAILLSSYAQLLPYFDGKALRIPADMSELVQKAYEDTPKYPDAWNDAYQEAREEFNKNWETAERRAQSYLLKHPGAQTQTVMADVMNNYINTKNGTLSEDQIGEARVRDSDASLEVIAIVVERDGDGYIDRYRTIPSATRKNQDIDWHNAKDPEEPTKPLAFELLASAIRLPYQYSDSPKNRVNGKLRFDAAIEELEDERIDSWQKSFMLAGELILPFELQDSGFYEVKLVDYLLRYSPELGLEAIQISDD